MGPVLGNACRFALLRGQTEEYASGQGFFPEVNMAKSSVRETVIGTRSGYVIRFTCPSCSKENSIVFNMPKAFYKESRDGRCSRCKKLFTVLTPGLD